METILKIEEHHEKIGYSNMAGYMVITDKQVIKLLIDDESFCCESWGYFLSEDNLKQFIGATLLDIAITDTELKTHLKEKGVNITYGGGVMFVNISTDKGLLQFTAYNEHNGYYGHNATVISEQLNHTECL